MNAARVNVIVNRIEPSISCGLLTSILFIFVININTARPSDNIATAGDIGQVMTPAAGLYMTYAYKDSDGTKELLKAYVTAMAATEGLKYAVNERRPNGGEHSFPSGHTASAFAGAAFIQQRFGWGTGIPAYLAASFVGYSRVESKNHYWHDVFAGAVIGIAPNLYFVSPYKDVAIAPVVGNGFYGVMIGNRF